MDMFRYHSRVLCACVDAQLEVQTVQVQGFTRELFKLRDRECRFVQSAPNWSSNQRRRQRSKHGPEGTVRADSRRFRV